MSGLSPLLEQRRAERQAREQALARAVASHQHAHAQVERASAALAEHARTAPSAPESGATTGVELARRAAFAQRHVDRTAQLKHALERARTASIEAASQGERAQRALAQGSADERAVEQHVARAEQSERRAQQRREQEEQDGDAAARIFARKGPPL